MTRVEWNTPLLFPQPKNMWENFVNYAEGYLSLGARKGAIILRTRPGFVQEFPYAESLLKTALKIASYILTCFIFPLCCFIVKLIGRMGKSYTYAVSTHPENKTFPSQKRPRHNQETQILRRGEIFITELKDPLPENKTFPSQKRPRSNQVTQILRRGEIFTAGLKNLLLRQPDPLTAALAMVKLAKAHILTSKNRKVALQHPKPLAAASAMSLLVRGRMFDAEVRDFVLTHNNPSSLAAALGELNQAGLLTPESATSVYNHKEPWQMAIELVTDSKAMVIVN